MPSCCTPGSGSCQSFDLLIIGGGSAAFAAAIEASAQGGTAVILNDGLPIGGTCVNVGCLPSKAMIRAAEAVHRASGCAFDGIDSRATVTDFGALTRQTAQLVEEMRVQKYIDVIADDENIVRVDARARFVDANTVEAGDRTYTGRSVLIATGARTKVPAIPGLEDTPFLTNEHLYNLDERPEHLIVLGGRYIGLENAQMMARLGSRVTLLQRSSRILPSESPEITDGLTGFLRDDGVDVLTSVNVQRAERTENGVALSVIVGGVAQRVEGSHLFLATGRWGNTDGLGLENLGVATDAYGYLQVDETLRAGQPNIFGAGDVLGSNQFVYTAAYEGKLAARNAMLDASDHADYSVLPWVVFTDPQVAGVGLDAEQARARGIDVEVSTVPLSSVPRALAARDTRGFITLIRDRASDRVVGARVLAPEGSELLMEVALAIRYRVTVEDLRREFHPYLTMSEGIKLAAIAFDKSVDKLSCCAA